MTGLRRMQGATGGSTWNPTEDLMRSWQRGCQRPLDEIVARYHTSIYNYLFRLTCQQALAEDLTEDCFVRLVNSGALYQYPRPFRPWLYTMRHQ